MPESPVCKAWAISILVNPARRAVSGWISTTSFLIFGPQLSEIFLVPSMVTSFSLTFSEIKASFSGLSPEILISTGVPEAPAPVSLFTLISASGIWL